MVFFDEIYLGYWWIKGNNKRALALVFIAYLIHLCIEGAFWLIVFALVALMASM